MSQHHICMKITAMSFISAGRGPSQDMQCAHHLNTLEHQVGGKRVSSGYHSYVIVRGALCKQELLHFLYHKNK